MDEFTAKDAKKIVEKELLKKQAEKEGERKVVDEIKEKAKAGLDITSFSDGYDSIEFEWLKDEAHQTILKQRGFKIVFEKGNSKLFETDHYIISWK